MKKIFLLLLLLTTLLINTKLTTNKQPTNTRQEVPSKEVIKEYWVSEIKLSGRSIASWVFSFGLADDSPKTKIVAFNLSSKIENVEKLHSVTTEWRYKKGLCIMGLFCGESDLQTTNIYEGEQGQYLKPNLGSSPTLVDLDMKGLAFMQELISENRSRNYKFFTQSKEAEFSKYDFYYLLPTNKTTYIKTIYLEYINKNGDLIGLEVDKVHQDDFTFTDFINWIKNNKDLILAFIILGGSLLIFKPFLSMLIPFLIWLLLLPYKILKGVSNILKAL